MKVLHDLYAMSDALDGSTITLLSLIVGSALWIVRRKLDNALLLLMMAPIAMLIAAVAYCSFLSFGMFNIKNMGEWLIWTIIAGTIGMAVVLCGAAMLASLSDRKEARVAAR